MSGLEELDLFFNEYDMRYAALLREDRRLFAEAFTLYSDQTREIARAALMTHCESPLEYFPFPDLTYPRGYDQLGAAVRVWSQRLEKFTIKGIFDESLFWPGPIEVGEQGETKEPEWPKLKDFRVRLRRHAPSGWRYFKFEGSIVAESSYPPRNPLVDPYDQPPTLPDDKAAEPWDPFHVNRRDIPEEYPYRFARYIRNPIPKDEMLQQLLYAWARALVRMPSLQDARLAIDISMAISVEWGVTYEAPTADSGVDPPRDVLHMNYWGWDITLARAKDTGRGLWKYDMTPEEHSCRRLIFCNTGDWRPEEKTMDLLLSLGSKAWPGTQMLVLTYDSWDGIIISRKVVK